MRKDNYQMIVRMNPEEKKKLDFVVKAYGVSISELIKNFINSEYDALNGQPELKKTLDDLMKIQEILQPYKRG